MPTERLLIQVDEKGARIVEGRLNKLGRTATASQKGVGALRRGLAGLAVGATVGGILKLADGFTNLQNKLRVVTTGTGNLNRVTNELFEITKRSRSSLDTNAALFSRLSLATKDLGTSQKEVLQFTESLNQATIISGASAEEARNAIIQLSQGLASGALRGDELRSVLEQLPVVADVIATELGVTRGELRELGKQGAITADVVLRAFRNARGELKDKFGRTVVTLGQAFTVLTSQIQVSLGRILTGSGILGSFANTVLAVSDAIGGLEVKFLQLDRAMTGSLTQADELSTTMKVIASAGVAAGFVIRNLSVILIEGLGVAVKAALTPLKALSNAFDEISKGNFVAAAKAIPNTFRANFGQIAGIVKNVGNNIVAETLDAAGKFNEIWSQNAREAGESVQQVLASGSLDSTPSGGGGVSGNAAALQAAANAQREYIQGLREQAGAQKLAAIAGVEGENALRLYNTTLEASAIGGDAFVAQALEIARGMNEQALAIEQLNDQREDGKVLESLAEEQRLLKLSNVERAIEINLRKLSKNATEEQKNQVRQLTFALETEREKLKDTKKDFEKFLKDFKASATNILAGALADPLGDGFKDLPSKFADLLVQMTSQLLASQFLKLLSESFGGGGGTGGLISSLIGAFAGGFATGGQFTVPGSGGQDSQLVGLRATPGETVTVSRPGQSIAEAAAGSIGNAQGGQPSIELSVINVTDPAEGAAAIASADGERAILNVISKNKEAIKQELA